MKHPKLIVITIILLFSFFLMDRAFAFRVTPTSFEMVLKKGETKIEFLTINNDSSDQINCQVYVTSYKVGRDGKPIFEETDTSLFSARKMVKIQESEVIIPARSEKKIAISVTLPRVISKGEYFATIMAVTQATNTFLKSRQAITQMNINLRLGAILRLGIVGPTIDKKAEITEIRVKKNQREIRITATLENKCSAHLEAKGEVLIKDLSNKIVAKFLLQGANKEVRGDKAFIYPQASRDFWGIVEKPLPAGRYLAEVIFDYGYHFRKIRKETAFKIEAELGNSLQRWLTMKIEPNTVKLEMKPGTLRRESVKIFNLDVNPLTVETSVKIFTNTRWLEVVPNKLIIRPQTEQSIRIIASLPQNETVERVGKIIIKPDRGNESSIDVLVEKRGNK